MNNTGVQLLYKKNNKMSYKHNLLIDDIIHELYIMKAINNV